MSTRAVSQAARAAAVLFILILAACSGGGTNGSGDAPKPGRVAENTPPPAPDLPSAPNYDDFDDPLAPDARSDFSFTDSRGRNRRLRARNQPTPEPERPTRRDVQQPDPRPSAAGRPGPDLRDPSFPELEARPERNRTPPAGNSNAGNNKNRNNKARPRRRPGGREIVVVWEALATEKRRLEESRFKRRGPQPPQKITLVNSSHPDARKFTTGRAGGAHGHVAVLPDNDLQAFLKGLQQQGFYRYARPVGNSSAALQSQNARGMIQITQNGRSQTLISMRGQGQNPQTRNIPRIYSQTKQAIMVLKNMSPTLNVSHVGAEPMRR